MHEAGIANTILEAGRAEAARLAGARLTRIGVRVGVLSGVDLQALEFALLVVRVGTDLEHVEIDLQSCPRRNRCVSCGYEFEAADSDEPCPGCAGEKMELIGGNELELSFVEVDEG